MSKLFSFLTFLILLTKTYSDDLGHVYSVGVDGSRNAALWVSSLNGSDSQEIILPGGEYVSSGGVALGARGVAFSNTHIYSVGQDVSYNAALWISSLDGSDSQEIILPGGEYNGSVGGVALGVALSNTHVYSVGVDSLNNVALWISSLDGINSQEIILPGGEYNGSNLGEALGVALSNTHVYSVGQDNSGNAALWISSLDGKNSQEISFSGGEYNGNDVGVALGVALSNTHVYSVGQDSSGNAALWISSLDGKSSQEIIFPGGEYNGSNLGEALGVALSNTHVYSVGQDNSGNAALWISSLDGSSSQEIILPGGEYNSSDVGIANGVALSNTHVYSVGQDGSNNAALWISNLDGSSSQEIIFSGGGIGNGIAVFSEPAAKLLLENLNRYSPFVRLKR